MTDKPKNAKSQDTHLNILVMIIYYYIYINKYDYIKVGILGFTCLNPHQVIKMTLRY